MRAAAILEKRSIAVAMSVRAALLFPRILARNSPVALSRVMLPRSSYSAGGEVGWQPGAGGEQFDEGLVFVFSPFGGGGEVGVHEGEFGEPVQGAPAAAGGALLDFHGPDGLLGLVVGPGRRMRTT